MKRYDPTRADRRPLSEKLVGLYMAASESDLAEANHQLAKIQGNAKGGRAALRFPLKEDAA